ncbi:hypothetical protein PR048_006068 [Dryococelus australis]|uniref:Uncharacterized protein n=1 Tax=Dryococelus australis TaxID=614101 RepID=A0ABQ9IB44_9NEOP|nr:hypothetical protein PR048_006068 [Dryococelus australis]
MDVEGDLILASLLIKRKKGKEKCRKSWVHPLLTERLNKGLFHNLFDGLQQDKSIRKQDTVIREAIPSDQRLALTLRSLCSHNISVETKIFLNDCHT